jgi:hypothetical protein
MEWDDEWIETARKIVIEEFNDAYSNYPVETSRNPTSKRKASSSSIFDESDEDSELEGNQETPDDELKHYLDSKVEKNITNPVLWWHENRSTYPCLSRMARNYLSVPGECSFYAHLYQRSHYLQPHRLLWNVYSVSVDL